MASAKQAWINKNRLPNETDAEVNERYRQHMAAIGAKGGKNSSGYGFAHGKVSPSIAGAIGGKKSKPFSRSIE